MHVYTYMIHVYLCILIISRRHMMLHNTYAHEFGSTIFVGTSQKINFTTLPNATQQRREKNITPSLVVPSPDSFPDPLSNFSVFPKINVLFILQKKKNGVLERHGDEPVLARGIGYSSVSSTVSTAARVADHTRLAGLCLVMSK